MKHQKFLVIDDVDPKDLVKQTQKMKISSKDVINPVSLKDVLQNTKPLIESTLDKITYLINTKTPQDEFPSKIIFTVPDKPIKECYPEFFISSTEPSPVKPDEKINWKNVQYANLDAMPIELRNVVRLYLSLLNPVVTDNKLMLKNFASAVDNLKQKLDELIITQDK